MRLGHSAWTWAVVAWVLAGGPVPSSLALNAWDGTTGNWNDAARWSGGVPQDGDEAVIASGSVLLTNETRALASFTMGGGTLTFSNWTAKLSATNVSLNGGVVTHVPNSATAAPWDPDGRVWIACSNLVLAAGLRVDTKSKGYAGGADSDLGSPQGCGPGRGTTSGGMAAGASHGGYGGTVIGYTAPRNPLPYDSESDPVLPGSGGAGSSYGATGAGGGAVRIEAAGTVTVNGTITAEGGRYVGAHTSGGSGGSISIRCREFAGTNGLLNVTGGSGVGNGGDAGGGRIAVDFDPAAQTAGVVSGVQFVALPGSGTGDDADLGTVWFRDGRLIPEPITAIQGQLVGFSAWDPNSVRVSNCWIRFPTEGFALTVTNGLTVEGASGRLDIGGVRVTNYYRVNFYGTPVPSTVDIGGDLKLTNGGRMVVYAGVTNAATAVYAARVGVTGELVVAAGCKLVPCSDPTNGGSAYFEVGSLSVGAGGSVDASARGYAWGDNISSHPNGYGPGRGTGTAGYGGGGYGGPGGRYPTYGGATYGSSNSPIEPGSGGSASSYGPAGYGGGLVRIRARGTVTVDGTIAADGDNYHGNHSSGGSGGGISIDCTRLAGGAAGLLSATGGDGSSSVGSASGGGGGRIALWRAYHTFQGTIAVDGGHSTTTDRPGGTGTIVKVDMGPAITNQAPVNTGATDSDLVGELTGTGLAPTEVYCFWGPSDGLDRKADWSNSVSLGFRAPEVLTNHVGGLRGGQQYHYRFYATNLYGDCWAEPTVSFSTVGGATLDNGGGAMDVGQTSAVLRGNVTSGNPTPATYICWGDNDPGAAQTGAWDHVLYMGEQLGAFSTGVTGLLANGPYYYRCYATNINGEGWAPDVAAFTTQPPTLAVADAVVTEGAPATMTGAVFVVSLSAASAADVVFGYSTSNGTAEAGSDYEASSGIVTITAWSASASIRVTVYGDAADEYPAELFHVFVSNAAGAVIDRDAALGTIADDDDVADTRTWTGTGNWNSVANWTPPGVPSPADTVFIASGSAALSNAAAVANATVQGGAVLVFSNWMTRLTAVDVRVASGGVVRVPQAFKSSEMSNRVWLVCTTLAVEAGGSINVDARGYAGGQDSDAGDPDGNGPGRGVEQNGGSSGGSHGGFGGTASFYTAPRNSLPYGSDFTPSTPGSGGAGNSYGPGGHGGGAVLIEAADLALVNGTISANAGASAQAQTAGGAGGSICIACRRLASTNATIRANGGAGVSTGGAGGGGRIALAYAPGQVSASDIVGLTLTVLPGGDGASADLGTIALPDTVLLPQLVTPRLQGQIVGVPVWSPASLTVSNAWVRFPEDGMDLSVGGDLAVADGARLDLGGARVTNLFRATFAGGTSAPALHVGGTLSIDRGGRVVVYASATNAASPDYGALLSVAGSLAIGTNGTLYLQSAPLNGGSPLIEAASVTIAAGGGIDASARGFAYGDSIYGNGNGYGPGRGTAAYGGAGYGGQGGRYPTYGGATYGMSNAPTRPGSGGAGASYGPGGSGGGLVRIVAAGRISLDGRIDATGGDYGGAHVGGGSGGGIFLRCRRFAGGASGALTAAGGDGYSPPAQNYGAGGGGGRIAVWYGSISGGNGDLIMAGQTGSVKGLRTDASLESFVGLVSVAGGTSTDDAWNGQPGTVVFLTVLPPPGAVIAVH